MAKSNKRKQKDKRSDFSALEKELGIVRIPAKTTPVEKPKPAKATEKKVKKNGKTVAKTKLGNDVIVSNHPYITRFFKEKLGANGKVMRHVTIEDIKDKKVFGAIPPIMGAYAKCVVNIILNSKGIDLNDISYNEFLRKVESVNEYKIQQKSIDWK